MNNQYKTKKAGNRFFQPASGIQFVPLFQSRLVERNPPPAPILFLFCFSLRFRHPGAKPGEMKRFFTFF